MERDKRVMGKPCHFYYKPIEISTYVRTEEVMQWSRYLGDEKIHYNDSFPYRIMAGTSRSGYVSDSVPAINNFSGSLVQETQTLQNDPFP